MPTHSFTTVVGTLEEVLRRQKAKGNTKGAEATQKILDREKAKRERKP